MAKFLTTMVFFSLLLLQGCSKTVESQMQEYLEFYYPSSGSFYYQIVFEWGDYVIDTGAIPDEVVHPDSEKYKGYITARTSLSTTPDGEELKSYLVTPSGEVWTTTARDIPERSEREEVTEEKTQYGTSTSTTTINSSLEPLVDDFLISKSGWKKYGILKSSGGKSTLVLEITQ